MGLHPAFPQVALGPPCSGHGCEFCSVAGEIVADVASGDGATRHGVGFPGVGRPALRNA